MIVVVMGVSGVGKSTVGRELAGRLGVPFLDADDLHPPENIAKMAAGTPLVDDDRWPWLDAVRGKMEEAYKRSEGLVVACSALKTTHRERLSGGIPGLRFILLEARRDVLALRLAGRRGHFVPGAALLESQLAALELPEGAIRVDVTAIKVNDAVGEIALALGRL